VCVREGERVNEESILIFSCVDGCWILPCAVSELESATTHWSSGERERERQTRV